MVIEDESLGWWGRFDVRFHTGVLGDAGRNIMSARTFTAAP